MARKWGICQKNIIPKSTSPGSDCFPVAAVQPMSGGMAPGIAPTTSATAERCLSGV